MDGMVARLQWNPLYRLLDESMMNSFLPLNHLSLGVACMATARDKESPMEGRPPYRPRMEDRLSSGRHGGRPSAENRGAGSCEFSSATGPL